ncbi:sodium- and chloride-dependent GABA transporter 2-like [Chrysoperla carnea]|uniref:sodium- and chloride-dependent GABA transporter 2-like n=1 Tax=Chrysoperla carnea TaxID=189513 RepID=UPI001D078031|nr:sodium- and chloride-dependent GABA transporter 2-like [Chrysoperla carnea]XP_044738128.1 sodium- and chloride-dependent GABA transporter 2-like [Chrysoperla carnea]XP_044738129.1 sodium- and chloride-dependent GABA transporter 2-like [Chrysoperla carnea]
MANNKKQNNNVFEVADSRTNLIPTRPSWDRPLEFFLSLIGYAIGLGNVWRFPYLCYKRGGGAFLIPYSIMLVTLGLPIFFLELAVGQFTSMGPTEVFKNIAPAFHGVGYATLVVIALVVIYYMVIVAWTIFYTFASFRSELQWGSCLNSFNSRDCYSSLEEVKCTDKNLGNINDTIFWNKTCTSVKQICEDHHLFFNDVKNCRNGTDGPLVAINKVISRIYASQEYYENRVLGAKDATWENFGYPQWELVLCLLLAWIIVYFCMIKGVQSAGKAVYFTALFPYVILTALFIRGITLPGAMTGLKAYMAVDLNLLTEVDTWADAASQIFYAFGIGCGSLITLASYNELTNNCHRDAILVSIANAFTSLFAGFCIFAVLGFLAHNLDMPVSEVVTDGPGLAFVAYPEAVLRMPLPQLWSVLFFFMLFILGLGSQFAGIEAISTTILDHWPHLRDRQPMVVLGICVTFFLLAIPMCCNGGIYLFTLMDKNTASWAILLIALAEVGSVSWVYGCDRFLKKDLPLMKMVLSKFAIVYWKSVLIFISPLFLVGVFVFTMATYTPASYGTSYVFPYWADAIGWAISLSTLAPMFGFLIYQVCYLKNDWKTLFTPTNLWGPAEVPKSHKTSTVSNINLGLSPKS